ncbi:hypothetical protein CYMTET_37151 [Cymbomonas tetramitiformis]|uniref:Uncharacterized protein n=1 Tax=Cymbomonas tetramitiformis TaxID=36881 RepID=A0AAE0CG28_9CHLO|nr:hypothetical protein CYMTET_37151 [Cymbomonas tetramitiformis]
MFTHSLAFRAVEEARSAEEEDNNEDNDEDEGSEEEEEEEEEDPPTADRVAQYAEHRREQKRLCAPKRRHGP